MEKRIISFYYGPKRKIDESRFAVFYKKNFPDTKFGNYQILMSFNNSLSYILKINSDFILVEEKNKKDLKEIIRRVISKGNDFLPNRARVNDLGNYWRIQKFLEQANDELVVGGDTLESKTMNFRYKPQDLK